MIPAHIYRSCQAAAWVVLSAYVCLRVCGSLSERVCTLFGVARTRQICSLTFYRIDDWALVPRDIGSLQASCQPDVTRLEFIPANSLRHVSIILTFASGDQFHYSCMLLHLEIYQLRTCSLKNLFALYRSLFAVKCSLYKCMCSQWNGRYSYGDVPVV